MHELFLNSLSCTRSQLFAFCLFFAGLEKLLYNLDSLPHLPSCNLRLILRVPRMSNGFRPTKCCPYLDSYSRNSKIKPRAAIYQKLHRAVNLLHMFQQRADLVYGVPSGEFAIQSKLFKKIVDAEYIRPCQISASASSLPLAAATREVFCPIPDSASFCCSCWRSRPRKLSAG
jgi:hypothetical protein